MFRPPPVAANRPPRTKRVAPSNHSICTSNFSWRIARAFGSPIGVWQASELRVWAWVSFMLILPDVVTLDERAEVPTRLQGQKQDNEIRTIPSWAITARWRDSS